jgi:hypothetical protein
MIVSELGGGPVTWRLQATMVHRFKSSVVVVLTLAYLVDGDLLTPIERFSGYALANRY